MVTVKEASKMALGFPEATEQDHFGFPSFRVRKKIFATLRPGEKKAMVKLTPMEQSVYCSFNKLVIYPVPGAWGKTGYTFIDLTKIRKAMFRDALTTAYCNVAPATLAKKVIKPGEPSP